MKIKKKNNYKLKEFIKNNYLKSIIFFSFIVVVFVSGGIVQKKGIFSNIKESLNYTTPINYLKSNLSSEVENLYIDIKFKDLLKIQKSRNKALENGLIITEGYESAKLTLNDIQTKVKLRLKGDLTDHLEGNKWSFRIKVKGDNTVFGMKTFSIHHPKTRNYIYEWMLHKFWKKEGLVALRYKFINVYLNGENLGIYALEEHFEKRLLENNGRKEGPIIKFDEKLYWDRYKAQLEQGEGAKLDYGRILSSNLIPFNSNDILSDSLSFKLFSKGVSLLEAFRRGDKSTSEVFDIDLLSTFYATVDLFAANHSLYYHNLRFYYNPITSLIEPIGFDGFNGPNNLGPELKFISSDIDRKIKITDDSGIADYMRLLFSDLKFYELYIQKLNKFSDELYFDSFFNELNEEVESNFNILHKEWPFLSFKKNRILQNQRSIKQLLKPSQSLHSYIVSKSSDNVELSISNIQLFPVFIDGLLVNDSIKIIPTKSTIITGKEYDKNVNNKLVKFNFPENIKLFDSIPMKLMYKILGTNIINQVEVNSWNNYDISLIKYDYVRNIDNTDNFDFVKKKGDSIIFKKGIHKISDDIHISANNKVIFEKGTSIDLLNNASIISKSPIHLNGTKENPIELISSDSTGQGIFVMKAKSKSVLNNVIFKNLSAPNKDSWSLTGAITFYESEVYISNCLFDNNIYGDDYLNIVRSDFSITDSHFRNVNADAFDSDFSTGFMKEVVFDNIGNDGIDISGTKLKIEDISMSNVGDKGISSGEKSDLIANRIEINSSEIAICCKDKSTILISNANLNFNTIGITAFQKKPEFGFAKIIATNTQISNTINPFLIETGSKLLMDGNEIKSNNEKVKDLLYGVIYGKSSK